MTSWPSRALRSRTVRRAVLAATGVFVRRKLRGIRSSIGSGGGGGTTGTRRTRQRRWPLLAVVAGVAVAWAVYRRTQREQPPEIAWAPRDETGAAQPPTAPAAPQGAADDTDEIPRPEIASTGGGAAEPDLADGEVVVGQPLSSDDLKVVEGIGPKIEQVLNDSGIATWHDLAGTAVDRLREILDAAGSRYRMHDPAGWPEQAALLERGDWQRFAELTGRLQEDHRS